MRKALILAGLFLLCAISSYAQFSFNAIWFPGGVHTRINGINEHGDIVGSYKLAGESQHALLVQEGEYIPLAQATVLGAYPSVAYKINQHGDVVGWYATEDGAPHGFLLSKGAVTTLDFPYAACTPATCDTYAIGINDSGTVVGFWNLYDADGNLIEQHGYTWNQGVFTQIDYPGLPFTGLTAINNKGEILGGAGANPAAGSQTLFIYSKGHFNLFNVNIPGATYWQANDFNDSGQVAGMWADGAGNYHGWLLSGANLTSVDFPGATNTTMWGIDKAGRVVGSHYESPTEMHGYLGSPTAPLTYTSIDYPGAMATATYDITNNGNIVGSYRTTGVRHALLITHGQFIPLAPTTVLGTNRSVALKSNERGDVVGNFDGDDGITHGFLLNKGVVTTLDFPGADATFPQGINDSRLVVGAWESLDSDGNITAQHGFLWQNGTFYAMEYPGAGVTALTGCNAHGDIVGFWSPSLEAPDGHGFLLSKGQYTSIDVPFTGTETPFTQANATNDSGDIVGMWADVNGVLHGFLKSDDGFVNIDYPGAYLTEAWGINNAGQIVGVYFDSATGPVHGMLVQAEKGGR
jgi:uncharacterized membrane protein